MLQLRLASKDATALVVELRRSVVLVAANPQEVLASGGAFVQDRVVDQALESWRNQTLHDLHCLQEGAREVPLCDVGVQETRHDQHHEQRQPRRPPQGCKDGEAQLQEKHDLHIVVELRRPGQGDASHCHEQQNHCHDRRMLKGEVEVIDVKAAIGEVEAKRNQQGHYEDHGIPEPEAVNEELHAPQKLGVRRGRHDVRLVISFAVVRDSHETARQLGIYSFLALHIHADRRHRRCLWYVGRLLRQCARLVGPYGLEHLPCSK
mmetsp:Transcript_73963/g.158508  ORF Transcript_73963/g.158508 Transcript_73963/m.158508 type:complete len:263 (-) Transcript_73963:59-847(-)